MLLKLIPAKEISKHSVKEALPFEIKKVKDLPTFDFEIHLQSYFMEESNLLKESPCEDLAVSHESLDILLFKSTLYQSLQL